MMRMTSVVSIGGPFGAVMILMMLTASVKVPHSNDDSDIACWQCQGPSSPVMMLPSLVGIVGVLPVSSA